MLNTLPALTGTEKQITWATDIRAKMIEQANDLISRMPAGTASDANKAIFIAVANRVAANASADYWISHREWTFRMLAMGELTADEKAAMSK
jgi:hypothetical protein